MRSLLAGLFFAVLTLVAPPVRAADDASVGYETIRPSLVKVWAFDRAGRPIQSGTGIVVDSGDHRSHVLTATHVVAGAASIRIDVSREVHDLGARIERTGPRDLTLLAVERGGLHAARFAPRSRAVVEGNLVAVAGYVKNDELIGVVGQEPRVLFPGTVASRPENGLYLELENVHVEEGLSGGAVFDPATGAILGIITSRTSDRRGGFADSAALVVEPFLAASNVAALAPPPVVRAAATAAPLPHLAAVPRVLAAPAARPLPVATLQAVLALSVPRAAGAGIVAWQSSGAQPKRFAFVHAGCRMTVTVDVSTLQFVIANSALVQPHHHGALLGLTVQQRADGCAGVADTNPVEGGYDPTAMSFDGHHVTMRFVYSGDASSGGFPSDASLDANLDGETTTATVQFFDRDWSGAIELPLSRTALAAISSSW